MGIAAYEQVYLDMLSKAATILGETGGFADQEATREYNVIHDAAINDPNKQCLVEGVLHACGTADFETAAMFVHTFLAERAGFVLFQLTYAGYIPQTRDPQIAAGGIADLGGSQQLTPGALVYATGANLGPAAQSAGAPLPRILGNTFVAVDGVRAPLVNTAEGQIEFQMPWDAGGPTASIIVSVNGALSNTVESTLQAAAPNILSIAHADGSAVAPGHAAARAETLTAYLIGLGAVNANLALGTAAPSNPLASTLVSPQLSVGDAAATVTFSGLAPSFIALYQVNFVIPSNAPSGRSDFVELERGGPKRVSDACGAVAALGLPIMRLVGPECQLEEGALPRIVGQRVDGALLLRPPEVLSCCGRT